MGALEDTESIWQRWLKRYIELWRYRGFEGTGGLELRKIKKFCWCTTEHGSARASYMTRQRANLKDLLLYSKFKLDQICKVDTSICTVWWFSWYSKIKQILLLVPRYWNFAVIFLKLKWYPNFLCAHAHFILYQRLKWVNITYNQNNITWTVLKEHSQCEISPDWCLWQILLLNWPQLHNIQMQRNTYEATLTFQNLNIKLRSLQVLVGNIVF